MFYEIVKLFHFHIRKLMSVKILWTSTFWPTQLLRIYVFYSVFHRELDLIPSPLCFVLVFSNIHVKQYRNLSYSWNCSVPHLYLIYLIYTIYPIYLTYPSRVHLTILLVIAVGLDAEWQALLGLASCLGFFSSSPQTFVLKKLPRTFVHRWVILLSHCVYQSYCAPVCVLNSHTLALQLERLKQRLALGSVFSFKMGICQIEPIWFFRFGTSEICNWLVWNSVT